MADVGFQLLVGGILFGLGWFSALNVVGPKRAFRYENMFQLRSVELSEFGTLMQVIGGVLGIVVGLFVAGGIVGPFGVVTLIAGVAVCGIQYHEKLRG